MNRFSSFNENSQSPSMKNISNVPKLVHDKVASSTPYSAMSFNCETALNALAVNKDFTQVVVAGRQVFKVLNIKDDCFTENTNLRVGKHTRINLTYSSADVAWHASDENILASAATNGDVVIWNLSKNAKSKQTTVYKEHKRSVNRVTFHGSEHNQLLSASQDGVVMIHDVRKPSVCHRFGKPGTESVRDAQFCPPAQGYFTFAAAYENGTVQTWDMRRPDRCERQFMAHNGPVLSLDWHPAEKTAWLATGGRDKMIKVWDMQKISERSTQPECLHSITNIYPLATIKWRPHRKHHIASSSLMMDHCVNVWDLGRPYIPFATFEGHTDGTTCIRWRDDCHVFLSCGKDGFIIQHIFSHAKRPADSMNLAGVELSINGDIGYAFSDRRDQPSGSLGRPKRLSRSREFTMASSSLCVFAPSIDSFASQEDESEMVLLQWFVELATQYQLEGQSVVDMCWHNGNVAECYRKPQIAQAWRMLAIIYSPDLASQPLPTHIGSNPSVSRKSQTVTEERHDRVSKSSKRPKEKEKKKESQLAIQQNDSSGSNDDSSEVEGESSEVDKSAPENTLGTNFLFGDGELTSDLYSQINMYNHHESYEDWKLMSLPFEGFQPRHELNQMIGSHPLMMDEETDPLMPNTSDVPHRDEIDISQQSDLLSVKVSHDMLPLDFSKSVADVITHFAEQGDVQTAVSMLTVLGDHAKIQIDELYLESWYCAYIDLLARFELWTLANTVIKHCRLMSVCMLNQNSTSLHTMCPKCSRQCERAPWLCDKCKRMTNICSVCHLPVKGLMVWCQGCCHGGHIEHMREWMMYSPKCPAGCGHLCEYV